MYDYWNSNPQKGKKNNFGITPTIPLQNQNSQISGTPVIDLKFRPIQAMEMKSSESAPVIPPQKKKSTKKTPKKDLTYYQAKRGKYPNLSPYGDADKDRVPNVYDCRPFDPTRDFFGLGDITSGASKFISKFGRKEQKPQRFPQKTVQKKLPERFPQKTVQKKLSGKLVYLYTKSEGKWSKVGKFDKDSDLLRQSVDQLYKEGVIEEHVVTGSPNDERKLNLGEKVTKPIIREAKRAKKHFIETAPKALTAYQRRIGLGETREKAVSTLTERVKKGLELKPYTPTTEELLRRAKKVAPRRVIVTEKIEDEEEFKPVIEKIKTEYRIPPTEEEHFIPKTRREPSFIPPSFEEKQMMSEEMEILPTGMEEISQPRRGMPPYSKGWAGSIGGSRPYRPVPYKPTGKIWSPQRRHSPTPKIPVAALAQHKQPERQYDLMPKIPIVKPFFVGKRIEEVREKEVEL